jgi:hypothetical protein
MIQFLLMILFRRQSVNVIRSVAALGETVRHLRFISARGLFSELEPGYGTLLEMQKTRSDVELRSTVDRLCMVNSAKGGHSGKLGQVTLKSCCTLTAENIVLLRYVTYFDQ